MSERQVKKKKSEASVVNLHNNLHNLTFLYEIACKLATNSSYMHIILQLASSKDEEIK